MNTLTGINIYVSQKSGAMQILTINNGYHNSDSFYEANGSYSILRSCNDWTAEALRKADVNTPLWSTLSSAIMFHLNRGCKCI